MKLILPFALLFAVWSACNLGEDRRQTSAPSNSTSAPGNSTSAPAAKATPDREEVKRELIRIANSVAQAAKDGDVTFLAKITTDDFQLTDIDGKIQNKNKALADVKEERLIRSFEISDEKLVSLDDSTAVLSYTLKVTAKNGRSAKAATTDTFVKQGGEWLLKSEQQTLLK
ncbi:nuclear transport factor 2 family protein [Leptolyngbya sp. 7M]|uniref:nuclear transport factor 2 family protein n=1 Tax=Leptolyngbya sp. 7M TaxID=2812896 RepID=UPI001B8C09FA|nr:nuclear transport factor 2 family protein [Leptolyngbya sp. 7M]QYO62350.1 nuclear transport factor 2 family protein [Leptolyngbya sp. 7M]